MFAIKICPLGLQVSCASSFEFLATLKTINPFISNLKVGPDSFLLVTRLCFTDCDETHDLFLLMIAKLCFGLTLQEKNQIYLLCVDNISAFYWLDYAVRAQPRNPDQATSDLTLQVAVASYL